MAKPTMATLLKPEFPCERRRFVPGAALTIGQYSIVNRHSGCTVGDAACRVSPSIHKTPPPPMAPLGVPERIWT